ncbi:hypothetical protein, partial [Streptomyces sp. NPDC058418]|uniref:hypothetical protein n=1 Tax=Streptomyces sp. NPDC058418 TaxID=3346488 RepID=UPI00365DFAA7
MPLQRHAELRPGLLESDVLHCLIDKTPKGKEEFLGAVRRSAVSVHDIPGIPIRPWSNPSPVAATWRGRPDRDLHPDSR